MFINYSYVLLVQIIFNNNFFFLTKDTLSDSYTRPYNDPPPYSIESEAHNNSESCETTDNVVDETDDQTTTKPSTSAKQKLGEKFGRFRRNGENSKGFGFQRF